NRLGNQGYAMTVEVREDAVEVVGDERASGATRVLLVDAVPEPEHEVIDEQLRAAVEEVRERFRPFVGLERVLLLDRDPRKLPAPAGELVASARMLFLRGEQLRTRRQPLLSRSHCVVEHRASPFRCPQLRNYTYDRARRAPRVSALAFPPGGRTGRGCRRG